MPQLNPAPWFMIMAMSWAVLLMLLSPKITTIASQNLPTSNDFSPHKMTPWNWPWT